VVDDGQIRVNALGLFFTKLDIDLLLDDVVVHFVAPKMGRLPVCLMRSKRDLRGCACQS
jgi:hypothetical protein